MVICSRWEKTTTTATEEKWKRNGKLKIENLCNGHAYAICISMTKV